MASSRSLWLGLACLAASAARAEEPAGARPAEYRIAALRAHAYYPELAQFDERDFFDPKLALWNTITGAGDARAPSEATLVVVELTGDFATQPRGKVELRALDEGGHEIHRSSVPLMFLFSEKRRVHVPFLVWGTGCGDLTLQAKLDVEGGSRDARSGVIGFRCGE
jgi:hypothetical protein